MHTSLKEVREVISADSQNVARGDTYTCPKCNTQIITDFGAWMTPYNMDTREQFERILTSARTRNAIQLDAI